MDYINNWTDRWVEVLPGNGFVNGEGEVQIVASSRYYVTSDNKTGVTIEDETGRENFYFKDRFVLVPNGDSLGDQLRIIRKEINETNIST